MIATPIEVAAECARQMAGGVCMTQLDPSHYPPGSTIPIAGYGRVPADAYTDYAALINPAMPNDPAMCHLALRKMTATPGGAHDVVARALWTPAQPDPQPSSTSVDVAAPVALAIAFAVVALTRFLTSRPTQRTEHA